MSESRPYASIDRVLRSAWEHSYKLREPLNWDSISREIDCILYLQRASDEPGERGHKPVYEVHFTRNGTDKNWRFEMAFLRVSSGDGNDDEVFRTIKKVLARMAS